VIFNWLNSKVVASSHFGMLPVPEGGSVSSGVVADGTLGAEPEAAVEPGGGAMVCSVPDSGKTVAVAAGALPVPPFVPPGAAPPPRQTGAWYAARSGVADILTPVGVVREK
jgi:hypothetical protein